MPRFTPGLLELVLIAMPLAVRRASLGVSEIILPTGAVLDAGSAMPRAESSNTVLEAT